jgi:NADH-quinone oxidoreductase subunit N
MILEVLSPAFNPMADVGLSASMLVLLVFGLLQMLLDAFNVDKKVMAYSTAGGLILSAILSATQTTLPYTLAYSNMIAFGGIAAFVSVALCISGLIALFFVEDFLKRHHKNIGEVYALILFATIGMIMLANANDLMILFIGLEIMSVCLYIMAGLFPRNIRSNESGLKYFLLGAFASGFLLYGISLLYGVSGVDPKYGPTMKLDVLAQILPIIQTNDHLAPMFYVAVCLILIGFAFKVAAFPFHSWTPDVYTGAPTPLAGFMATGSKMAAFIALAMFMGRIAPGSSLKITSFLLLLAVASMIYGNVVAAQQTNIKRLLAYSSIAHTGYLLLGIASGERGYQAVIFYMIIYTIMTVGAFGIISMIENEDGDAELTRWKGLGLKNVWLGVAMSTFLFSLAGMPPLAGFFAKYFVFESAIREGHILPAVIGILTSVVGAYYYLRVIVIMYFQKADVEDASRTFNVPTPLLAGALTLVVILIILGVFPTYIQSSLDMLFSGAGLMSGQ